MLDKNLFIMMKINKLMARLESITNELNEKAQVKICEKYKNAA